MRSLRFVAVALVLGLVSCVSTGKLESAFNPEATSGDTERWDNAVGVWKGNTDLEGGGRYEWVMTRTKYSKFQVNGIVENADGDRSYHTEVGEWGIDGNIYFISSKGEVVDGRFQPFDLSNPRYFQAYEIMRATPEEFDVKLISSGDVFRTKKVGEIPDEET